MKKFEKSIYTGAQILLTIILLFIGYRHLVNPAPFVQLLPSWFPLPEFAIWISGIVELILGIWWWFSRRYYGHWAAFLVFLMLVVYLPLHIIDATRPEPIISSAVDAGMKPVVAWARILFQFLFLFLTWKIYKIRSERG